MINTSETINNVAKHLSNSKKYCIFTFEKIFIKKTIIMAKSKQHIAESKVIVENGNVKTMLSDKVIQDGFMNVEEAKKLTLDKIRKIYELNGKL
jgi:hypothetical protein